MVENKTLFDDLNRFPAARVLCIGDVMLDRFVYGAVERISPEAPIPVLHVEREKAMLGGAGNVAANIAALGAKAVLLSVVGKDAAGQEIARLLDESGIGAELVEAPLRQTTVKSRFVCGTQQVLRVDREKTEAVAADIEETLLARAAQLISATDAVILSDYGKGVLTDAVIASVIALAQKAGKPVIVDPKGADFSRYRGATVVTPNRKELETATGMKAATDETVRAAAMKIIVHCGIANVLATRSKDGMALISAKADPLYIPAHVREIYDVSGAGDTVIAAFSAALAAGADMPAAAWLSNIAAGIVVGKPGTATARPEEIEKVLREDFMSPDTRKSVQNGGLQKAASRQTAAEQSERWKIQGLKVGFTNGCFDLLHPGHLSVLRQARAACDRLIVAINSDASVRRLKGPTRPVQDETARATILSALEMVDMVVVFDEDTPIELLKAIRPDVLVKGGQYKLEEVVGYDIVMAYGGKIVRADMEEGFSTTNTIAKMAG